MTVPTQQDMSGALDDLSRLAAGNDNVVARPNLMGDLLNSDATPAETAAINQFVGGLQAENAVAQLRAGGTKAVLPAAMVTQLQAVGAQYQDVMTTAQAQQNAEISKIKSQGLMPVYNNGQLIGARQPTQSEQNKHSDGWFSSFGGFWHHLTHNPVTNTIGEGFNLVNASLGNLFESSQQSDENKILMKALGYDPTSQISQMAYAAKGYERGDISGVVKKYGQDQVNEAAQYLADPAKYTSDMVQEANTQDPSGKLAAQKMAQIDSPQFGNVLKELSGHTAGLGNDLANLVGLDPVKNPKAWAWTAGGTDFVASFAIDPTMIAGRLLKGAKIAQVGIKSFVDTDKIAQILDKSNGGFWARNIQRGFQSAVDNGNMIREGQQAATAAESSGDLHALAAAQAQMSQGYAGLNRVGLQALAPALVGTHRVTGLDEANNGLLKVAEGGEPLDTYDKLFDYVVHTKGMLALQSGKAAVESSLMPGALSRVGASFIHDALDGARAKASTAWNFRKLDAATKILPSPTDAVDVATGEHLSQATEDTLEENGLASQRRAGVPSAAQLGEVDYNLRRYGNMTGTGIGGALGKGITLPTKLGEKLGEITPGSWINPVAVAARARLAARRLNVTNLLPRNNRINLLDEQSPTKVLQFAKLYLPPTQSHILAAAYAAGDVGAKRAVLQGLKTQVFHAAGLYHSESGTEFANNLLKEDSQIYTHSADGIMEVDPWTGEQDLSSALWNAQNRVEYSMPSFSDLHTHAAKLGMYESMVGRAMTSHLADSIGSKLRLGMLATPRTAVRATVEGWVNLLARGDAPRALAAKARMIELDKSEAGAAFLPQRGRTLTKATGWFLPQAVGTVIKHVEKRGMTDNEAMYLERLYDTHPEIAHQVQESLQQHLLKGDINPLAGSQEALDIARTGFPPTEWEVKGWEPQSTAGWAGAHHLEAALKLRESGNPKTFQSVLDYVGEPSLENYNRVKDAMLDPAEYAGFRRMRWTSVWSDPDGRLQRAVTEDEKQVAFEQHADRLISDLRHLVTGQNGELATNLIDKMRNGLPDAEWINENLRDAARPESAIARAYLPKVVDGADDMNTARAKVATALQDLTGKMYKKLVTDPAERMTSMPAFWANYVKTRTDMAPLEKALVEHEGYSAETADELLMHRAIRQAWVKTEYTVDDPGAKTQMDIVGRNLMGFPRAINAFLRRYGQLVKQDPFVIRKAFLMAQGAEHMGLVYKDQNGDLTYTVPGSGFLVNALNTLGGMLGLQDFVALPQGDLTGKVLMSAPGFDNPIRPSLSPMLNIPFHYFANLFPDHREMIAEIDNVLNGPTGAGRPFYSPLVPAALTHFWEALDPNERNSLIASATIGAISNLVASDPNGDKGIVPNPATDPGGIQMAKFLSTVKTQVRNQLFMRAVLGLWLPGAPSRPSDATSGSQPDESYFIRGARSMSDEFKMMINDFGGDYQKALQAFIAVHPNGLVYTLPTSTVTKAGLNIPATRQSEQWMEKNYDLIQKYPDILPYFAPDTNGKFDALAWQAQLADGIRQKVSIDDFAKSWELKTGQQTYFAAYDQMKAARDAALAEGDTKRASYLKSNFTEQMAPFVSMNPVLQEWLASSDATKTVQAQKAVHQLQALVQSNDFYKLGPNAEPASQMLDAWTQHQNYQGNHMAYNSTDRAYESQVFGEYMMNMVAKNPALAGLYGVFQALDFKALPKLTTAG